MRKHNYSLEEEQAPAPLLAGRVADGKFLPAGTFKKAMESDSGGAYGVMSGEVDDSITALEDHDRQLAKIITATESLAKQGLTREIAVESMHLLGNSRVMNVYYAEHDPSKKLKFATEEFVEKFKAMLKRAYELIIGLIKKCIAWFKSFFSRRKTPPAQMIKQLRLTEQELSVPVEQAALKAPRNATGIIQETSLDDRFTEATTREQYDILVEGNYTKKLFDLIAELRNSEAAKELSETLDELATWYKEKLAEAGSLDQLAKKANGPSGLEKLKAKKSLGGLSGQFHEAIYSDTTNMLNGNRTEADRLHQIYFEAEDLHHELQQHNPTTIETLYDLRSFFQLADHVIARGEDVQPVLDRWTKDLEDLEKHLQRSLSEVERALSAVNESGTSSYLAEVHREYFNTLNTIPQRLINVNKMMVMIYRYFDDSTRLYVRMIEYVANAAGILMREDHSEEMQDLYQVAKAAAERLAKLF